MCLVCRSAPCGHPANVDPGNGATKMVMESLLLSYIAPNYKRRNYNGKKVFALRFVKYNVGPLASTVVIDADTRLDQFLLSPCHQTNENAEFALHSIALALENCRVQLFGHLDTLRALHELGDGRERGVFAQLFLCKVGEGEKRHRAFKISEEFGVLSSARRQFKGCELQCLVDTIRADELDKAQQEQVEEERRVGIQDLVLQSAT